MSVILTKSMKDSRTRFLKKQKEAQKGLTRDELVKKWVEKNKKENLKRFAALKKKRSDNKIYVDRGDNAPKSLKSALKSKSKKVIWAKKTAYGRTEIQKLTKSKIRKDLDIIFSTWRRMVNADDEGNLKCCSCNTPRHWTELTNGHYISRAQAPGLIFNEMNTGAQCKRCNGFLEGNATGYRENLIKLHGINKVEWLESVKYLKSGNGVFEFKILLLEYIAKFKKQCARLNYTPNITEQRVLKRWVNK